MSKSDFICKYHGTKSRSFLSFGSWNKFTCPNCGDLCEDCVESHVFGGKTCRHCNAKVLSYEYDFNRNIWKQI
jgi:hypothetical protein